MFMKKSRFIEIIKKLIERERKIKEASTSANVPGYMTPNAFSGKGKMDRRNSIASGSGYEKVNEVKIGRYDIGMGSKGNGITLWNRNVEKAGDYKSIAHIAPNGKITNYEKRQPKEVTAFIEKIAQGMKDKPKSESVNEFKNMSPGLKRALAQKGYGPIFFTIDQSKKQLKQLKYSRGEILDTLYTMFGKEDPKIVAKIKESVNKVNEGKYHDYRNDESMTPKQKIGNSMREVRNALTELGKLIDMNVRLKNELNVDSRSYWKNTHKALSKISERLVKLANKVGKMQ